MKYEKFDVELALAGEPVILRNGFKAYIRHKEAEFKNDHPLIGIILESSGEVWLWMPWTLSGTKYSDGVTDFGITGMYPKEPLTMPDSFWDMLHPHYNVIAKDGSGSGTWYAYHEKPEKMEVFWNTDSGDFINLSDVICCSFFPDCDWEDSLILRPDK